LERRRCSRWSVRVMARRSRVISPPQCPLTEAQAVSRGSRRPRMRTSDIVSKCKEIGGNHRCRGPIIPGGHATICISTSCNAPRPGQQCLPPVAAAVRGGSPGMLSITLCANDTSRMRRSSPKGRLRNCDFSAIFVQVRLNVEQSERPTKELRPFCKYHFQANLCQEQSERPTKELRPTQR